MEKGKPNGNGDSASKSRLPDAVLDAQILLAFAAQTGVDLSDRLIKTIVDSAAQVRRGELEEVQEAAFWSALQVLAKAVSPVSISSLRATMDSHPRGPQKIFGIDVGKSSPARWVVRTNTIGILAVLLVLLLVQIYWVFGNSIITDIQSNRKQIAGLRAEAYSYIAGNEARKAAFKAASQPADGDAKAKKASLKVVSLPLDGDPKLTELVRQLRRHQLEQQTSYHLLERWTNFFSGMFGDRLNANSVVETICDGDGDGKDDAAMCRNVARTQSVTVFLEILQRYALPLLYGLLGSFVYVLRSLAGEIRTRTFTEASIIGFRIRLCLGMLGGMVVAWFVTPETADGLFKSLSPFALAFLAGYSIELVFAAMDRFLAAFTTTTQTAKQ